MEDFTGDGLKVVIESDYTFCQDWMSFAAWYSVRKILPDAEIGVLCRVKNIDIISLFAWPYKCGCRISLLPDNIYDVKLANYFDKNNNYLVIPPHSVMVRPLETKHIDAIKGQNITKLDSDWMGDIKAEEFLPFVSYKEGCGKFVTASWIHSIECPFQWADRFMTHSASANEIRILKLWNQLSLVYPTVSRG